MASCVHGPRSTLLAVASYTKMLVGPTTFSLTAVVLSHLAPCIMKLSLRPFPSFYSQ